MHLRLAVPMAPSAIGNDYFPAPDQHQERYSLNLFLCTDCGNVQIEDVVDPALLFRNYTYSTTTSLGLVEHFRKYAVAFLQRVPTARGGLAVDIGSNDGSLLRAFKEQGLRVLGIDPAVEIAKKASQEGLPTVPEFFTSKLARQLKKAHGPAAIITANNVFAHSDQLPDMADGIREMLAPDGVFSFEVSYLVDILEKMLFDTVYHEHLCYHSVRPLRKFFEQHDLELIDIERLPTKGGSLRCSVQKKGGPRSKSTVIDDLIRDELKLGLDKVETFHNYAERFRSAGEQVRALLKTLRSQGKKIAGYGASPTVTTLIDQFDLGDYLDFLVDDNPAKQNTYSPGRHIPVHASPKLYEGDVSHAVILAWNYAQPIIKRHQKFIDQGGRFVIPLPALKVA
jgi:hypothetical protein